MNLGLGMEEVSVAAADEEDVEASSWCAPWSPCAAAEAMRAAQTVAERVPRMLAGKVWKGEGGVRVSSGDTSALTSFK